MQLYSQSEADLMRLLTVPRHFNTEHFRAAIVGGCLQLRFGARTVYLTSTQVT
jgi:hypothetical protein